jgi:hypothetical protein
MRKCFGAFARLFAIVIVAFVLLALFAPVVLAQGPTPAAPPALPSLDALLAMSMRALGGLVFISLFGYAWGYLVSAIAARVPAAWKVPSWAYDLAILIPTAAVAAGWNAFAVYADAAFPGVLDKTVAQILLWAANAIFALLFARKGGIAQVVDLARLGIQSSKSVSGSGDVVSSARSGVLFVR